MKCSTHKDKRDKKCRECKELEKRANARLSSKPSPGKGGSGIVDFAVDVVESFVYWWD
jgi:hypothetical protein